jgi:putative flippase GtrA
MPQTTPGQRPALRSLGQFIKFSLVGVSNTLVTYLVFLLLYSWLGMHYLLASALGWLAGMLNSYLLNRSFTFRVRSAASLGEGFKFALVSAGAGVLNLALLHVLVQWAGLRPEIAQVLAIIGSYLPNFLLTKLWIFRDR